ncbi:hypothetical protein WJX84_001523 [Apatococcus fuscideae]|uniref:BRISC and BRCA1-A complex member 2 n=1 Tax=Apatococcus fuscideae TaxID=2026836 RepID=A0AAW1T8N9_9CHLO
MFLVWQISFHRDSKGQVLLDIAFKEHPGFNPLAAGGRSLEHLLEAWNLNQERQLYQVLEQVFLRFAQHQQTRFQALAANDDRLAFDLQTVHRPGLQLLALETLQKLVLVVPLEGVSLELIHGQLAALNPGQPLNQAANFVMEHAAMDSHVASELEGDMKVKAVYRLLNGKVTAEKPDLENFLPAQLQQLIGAVEVSWQAGTCLSEHVAVVAARVQQQVAAAATDFTWRQQLFTHLADEIGWPLGMDEAQQRWACYTVQVGKGSAALYVEAERPFPTKAPRLSLRAHGGQSAQVVRIPQYDWSERWPPARMAQQIKATLNKQIGLLPPSRGGSQ